LTTSWARYSVALTGDTTGTWATDNTAGLLIGFDLGSGSNYNTTAGVWQSGTYRRTIGSVQLVNQTAGATLHITGVQVELGTTASTFEHRPYGVELVMCQRYYYRVTPIAGEIFGHGLINSTSTTVALIQFPVKMRISPAAVERSATPSDYSVIYGSTSTNCTAVPSYSIAGTANCRVTFTTAAVLTTGQVCEVQASNTNGYLGFSARL